MQTAVSHPASLLQSYSGRVSGVGSSPVQAPHDCCSQQSWQQGQLTQEAVPSWPVQGRAWSCRWPSAHFPVQRPRLEEICIGGQPLTAVALMVSSEEKHLTAIPAWGALAKRISVLVMSEVETGLWRAAVTGGWLHTRAVLEPGTEGKNTRNSHHQSILLPKPNNLHCPAQEPTLWSRSEAHCKNKHKFYYICFSHSQVLKQKCLTEINELIFQSYFCPFFKIQIRCFFD